MRVRGSAPCEVAWRLQGRLSAARGDHGFCRGLSWKWIGAGVRLACKGADGKHRTLAIWKDVPSSAAAPGHSPPHLPREACRRTKVWPIRTIGTSETRSPLLARQPGPRADLQCVARRPE